ncbi:hypothetical protein LINPERPRIM_LOCUS21820 [Linum perenne]
MKVNVDAAISRERHCHGMGMMARDWAGNLVSYKQQIRPGVPTPQEVEARCLVEALRWAANMGWSRVCFEADCQLVQQVLIRQDLDTTEFGDLISECRRLLGNQLFSKVCYVRRESNMITDALAKRSM